MKTFFLRSNCFALLLLCSAPLLFGQVYVDIDVSASSTLSDSRDSYDYYYYSEENLIDDTWHSWAEGVAGSGIGESLTFSSKKYISWNNYAPGEFTVFSFGLKNGYGDPRYYSKNNRVKTFKVYADGEYIETISVKDSSDFELYVFSKPITCKVLKFVIDSVYRGTVYNDTCIEELSLFQHSVTEISDEFMAYFKDYYSSPLPHSFVYNVSSGVHLLEVSSAASGAGGNYPAENLIDMSWHSWAEGVEGNGIGEYFTFGRNGYTQQSGYKLWGLKTAGFTLKNGYGNPDYYGKNNRVKAFKIYADGKYIETIQVKDSVNFEQYAFTKPIYCTELKFVIDAVYPGTDYDDTCIEEIALLHEVISDEEFNEKILFWIAEDWDEGPSMYKSHNDVEYRYDYNTGEYLYIDKQIPVVGDADEDAMLLKRYLPFEVGIEGFSSDIALLNGTASLRLKDKLPRLDGATAMYPLYSAFVHAVYPEEELKEHEYGYRYSLAEWKYFPKLEVLRESEIYYPPEKNEVSIVQCNKTPQAYQRLIDGETDIIFCYEPSAAEIQAAAEKGLKFNLTPIAKDAFVFIVNEKNPLNNITANQIRDIYSSRVINWKSITGIDEPIIAYQRPEKSGSQTILQSIMKGDKIMRPIMDAYYIPMGMFGMIEKIASSYYNYNAAIGYTFRFYLNAMVGSDSGTKVLSINGIAPNQQNIQSGAYPYTQTVYAVTTGNESENTKKFIEWIISAQGQELVKKTGYIPIR